MKALVTFPSGSHACLLGVLLSAVVAGGCRGLHTPSVHAEIVEAWEAPAPPLPLGAAPASAPRATSDKEPLGVMRVPSRDDRGRRTFHRPGLFVGGKLAAGDVNGDLDGSTTVVDDILAPTEFVFLPDIETGAGVGIDVGYRFEEWEILVSWTIMEYDGEFGGADLDTQIQYLDLMFRQYYWIGSRLQPFVTGGIGVSEGTIEDGAMDPMGVSDGEIVDGVNYNIGAGMAFYPHPWVSVYGQALWRFGRYDAVKGPFGKIQTDTTVDADAWEISTGVTFRVLSGRD